MGGAAVPSVRLTLSSIDGLPGRPPSRTPSQRPLLGTARGARARSGCRRPDREGEAMQKETGPAGVRQDALIAGALAMGFLLLYLRTLCPTVYLGDAGEISTAIATGGVVHPPGYPLFSLLGRAALV